MTARVSQTSSLATSGFPDRQWDGLQFRAIFALTFPVYLAAAVGARLSPGRWRRAAPPRSIFSEAVQAAGTTAQMAFAG